MLRHEDSVHATAVVVGVEEVADVEAQRQFADLVVGSHIEDGTGGNVSLSDNFLFKMFYLVLEVIILIIVS